MFRRDFLKTAGLLIGGLAIDDAMRVGRVFSFPSKILPRASWSDSAFFVRLDSVTEVGFLKPNSPAMLKRELYERESFYRGESIPAKVEYEPFYAGYSSSLDFGWEKKDNSGLFIGQHKPIQPLVLMS
jgi:hypothetical protein